MTTQWTAQQHAFAAIWYNPSVLKRGGRYAYCFFSRTVPTLNREMCTLILLFNMYRINPHPPQVTYSQHHNSVVWRRTETWHTQFSSMYLPLRLQGTLVGITVLSTRNWIPELYSRRRWNLPQIYWLAQVQKCVRSSNLDNKTPRWEIANAIYCTNSSTSKQCGLPVHAAVQHCYSYPGFLSTPEVREHDCYRVREHDSKIARSNSRMCLWKWKECQVLNPTLAI